MRQCEINFLIHLRFLVNLDNQTIKISKKISRNSISESPSLCELLYTVETGYKNILAGNVSIRPSINFTFYKNILFYSRRCSYNRFPLY